MREVYWPEIGGTRNLINNATNHGIISTIESSEIKITKSDIGHDTIKMEVEDQQPGQNNVLFEPAIYQQPAEEDAKLDEAMGLDDTESQRTNVGSGAPKVAGQAVDKALLEIPYIRCCICGIMTQANAANTCINCLKSQIDITEGIPKQLVLYHCRDCNRY